MFPFFLQKSFAWIVPAFIGVLGVASILAWRTAAASRTAWHLAAGILALGHAALAVANLSVRGNAYGSVPFSAGTTGYGPRSVAVDFLAQCCLVAAVSAWALAALSFGNTHKPIAHQKRPQLLFLGAIATVGAAYALLEAFG